MTTEEEASEERKDYRAGDGNITSKRSTTRPESIPQAMRLLGIRISKKRRSEAKKERRTADAKKRPSRKKPGSAGRTHSRMTWRVSEGSKGYRR